MVNLVIQIFGIIIIIGIIIAIIGVLAGWFI